jgi:hypothetical protein
MVDWTKSPLARLVSELGADLIAPTGLCGINKLVEIGLPNGVLARRNLDYEVYRHAGKYVSMSASLHAFEISGLDTFTNFEVLGVEQKHSLKFAIAMEKVNIH